ncbi:MAG: FAD-binding protein [Burkholderiaceae bacterium]|nr:FAD-binding protein [Burkholderiaceae bacterium]
MNLPAEFQAAMAERFGDRFSTARALREQHGRDESRFDAPPPDAVLHAIDEAEVAQAVALCRDHAVPIIPFGAGSSVEGQLIAVRGGLSLDLSRMNQVLAIRPEELSATVQAGVTRKQLNEALKATGLFFAVDPGADATLGGMCATRASGTAAVRYGTMRENVLALNAVTADGQVLRTSSRARKSAAGYDLKSVFIGSEGTLGLITEVTVKLHPVPVAMSAAVVNFPSLGAAIDTVIEAIQCGVPLARAEYLDAANLRAINAYSKTNLREADSLFFEFHGSEAGVREQAEQVQAIAADHGGQDFEWAERPEDRSRLWNARHTAFFAILQSRPGCRAVLTDTCVPISRLADSIAGARALLDASALPASIGGHVGDGNFHCAILVNPDAPHEIEEAERLNAQIVRLAQSMDGTCSGEHGVGLHKVNFLEGEVGAHGLHLMRALKQAFDPEGLLNPGKMLA